MPGVATQPPSGIASVSQKFQPAARSFSANSQITREELRRREVQVPVELVLAVGAGGGEVAGRAADHRRDAAGERDHRSERDTRCDRTRISDNAMVPSLPRRRWATWDVGPMPATRAQCK